MAAHAPPRHGRTVNVAVVGALDSGKSTLIGHLAYSLGYTDERTARKLQEVAADLGKATSAFAFVCDQLRTERERGLTIRGRSLVLPSYQVQEICLIDTPGHQKYSKNRLRECFGADIALAVYSECAEEVVASMRLSFMHQLECLRGMGVRDIVIAVNLMDRVNYSEEVFQRVSENARRSARQSGFGTAAAAAVDDDILVVPVSSFYGTNLCNAVSQNAAEMGWWARNKNGMTLWETLLAVADGCRFGSTTLSPPTSGLGADQLAARFVVQDVLKIKGVGDVVVGTVASGEFRANDTVKFVSNTTLRGAEFRVFSIESFHVTRMLASAGDRIGMNLKISTETRRYVSLRSVKKGEVLILAREALPPVPTAIHVSMLFVRPPGPGNDRQHRSGQEFTVVIGAAHFECKLEIVGQDQVKARQRFSAILRPRWPEHQPVFVEEFDMNPTFGRFVCKRGPHILGWGKVDNVERIGGVGICMTKSANKKS